MDPTRLIGFTPLMTALYTRLTGHASTSGYNTYNYIPDEATLPYITIVNPIGNRSDFSAIDEPSESNTVMVHVWSSRDAKTHQGDKECADIMNDVSTAITSSVLTITGYTNIITLLDFYEIIVDETEPAKPVSHGVMRFRFEMG